MVYRLRTRIQLLSIMGNGYMEKMHRAILRIKEVHKDCHRAFPCFLFSQEVCVFRKTSQESKAHGISCTSALCPNLPLLKEKKNAKYIHECTFHLFPYSPLKDPPVHACSAKTLENAIFHWKNSIVFSQHCPGWKAPALPWAVLTATTSIQPLGHQTRLKARSGWRILFKKPKMTLFHACSSQCYQAGESFPLGRSQSSVSDPNPSDFAIYCTLL